MQEIRNFTETHLPEAFSPHECLLVDLLREAGLPHSEAPTRVVSRVEIAHLDEPAGATPRVVSRSPSGHGGGAFEEEPGLDHIEEDLLGGATADAPTPLHHGHLAIVEASRSPRETADTNERDEQPPTTPRTVTTVSYTHLTLPTKRIV